MARQFEELGDHAVRRGDVRVQHLVYLLGGQVNSCAQGLGCRAGDEDVDAGGGGGDDFGHADVVARGCCVGGDFDRGVGGAEGVFGFGENGFATLD